MWIDSSSGVRGSIAEGEGRVWPLRIPINVRRGAVTLIGVVYLLVLCGIFLLYALHPTPGVVCTHVPVTQNRCTVHFVAPGSPVEHAGLHSGDVVLTIDRLSATIDHWGEVLRRRHVGDDIILRVRHAGNRHGPVDVSIRLISTLWARAGYRLLNPPDSYIGLGEPVSYFTLFTILSLAALLILVVCIGVALAQPSAVAAGLLLLSGASFAYTLALPWLGTAVTLATGVEALVGISRYTSQLLSVVGYVAGLHLFLAFPHPHPFLSRLRAAGPASLRRVGGSTLLLYAVPVVTVSFFGAGIGLDYAVRLYTSDPTKAFRDGLGLQYLATWSGWYAPAWFAVVGLLWTPAILAFIHDHRRYSTVPARVQRIPASVVAWALITLPLACIAVVLGPFVFVPAAVLAATLLALGRSYQYPLTPFARVQLKWILWMFALVMAAWLLVWLVGAVNAKAGILWAKQVWQPWASQVWQTARLALLSGWSFVPVAVATGIAVLRYRLFGVSVVLRASLFYPLLTALIVVVYLAVAFVLGHAATAVVGHVAGVGPVASVAAALAVAGLASPAHRQLQAALDRLIFRDRLARDLLLQEAGDELGRAQPLEVVTTFLTHHTASRLNLTGAWLAVPSDIAAPGADLLPDALRRASEPLFVRLRDITEPIMIVAPDTVATWPTAALPATDPAIAPWSAVGAHLLVPLRTDTPAWASFDETAPAGPSASSDGQALVGVWALGLHRSGALLDQDDLVALARVGRLAAVLIDNARLHQQQVEQALMRHDVERAAEIQRHLLPATLNGWPGQLEIAARFRPARETSGDFYDVFALSHPTSTNGAEAAPDDMPVPLQIAVGDVVGKGMAAALVMALARATLRAVVQSRLQIAPGETVAAVPSTRRRGAPLDLHNIVSPATALRLAGRLLYEDLGRQNFVACALAVVEPISGPAAGCWGARLRLANAAQVPPLLCRRGDAQELQRQGERLPLGVLPDPHYDE